MNINSQAPNQVIAEWLAEQNYSYIKPEYTYGQSRIDFYMEKGDRRYLMEVKGCTLERDRIGYFPDAPTKRGVKHLHELIQAAEQGFHPILVFVIPMEGVYEVRANTETDPDFAQALALAKQKGIEIWYLPCKVTADTLCILQDSHQ